MANPLALFPLEVWEMILDRVFDSETVYHLLQMFPQLDEAFQKKKHVWLLGKILPFVTTWTKLLNDEELMNCRIGCKHWIQQVDNFLENQQPRLRPYLPDLHTDDQFIWNSKAHCRQYHDLDVEKVYYGGVLFDMDVDPYEDDHKTVDEFLEKMGTHPEDKNPFLARCLSVKVADDYDDDDDNDEPAKMVEYLQKVMKVLETFGKHIWFYSISFEVGQEALTETCDWLTRSLALLPNLKSLDLSVYIHPVQSSSAEAETTKQICGTEEVPIHFPFLESLEMSKGVPGPFAQHLLGSITTPIRKLTSSYAGWREDYTCLLPTVTELKLEGIRIEMDGDWARFINFMLSLEAPQLVKLELELLYALAEKEHHPIYVEDDIFTWIKRFPSLRYFNCGCGYSSVFLQEKGTLLPERDSLPNLQFLSIRDSIALSYDFLLCLPSLQHLQIFTDYDAKVMDLSNEKVVRIREQIETGTMHTSNIWELLPSLRSVTILNENYSGEFACDREKYNYFKEHPDYDGFEDFRKDIAMRLMWMADRGRSPGGRRRTGGAYLRLPLEREMEGNDSDEEPESTSSSSSDEDPGDSNSESSNCELAIFAPRRAALAAAHSDSDRDDDNANDSDDDDADPNSDQE